MSGAEQAIVIVILAVFVFFMAVLAWGDMHTRDARKSWD